MQSVTRGRFASVLVSVWPQRCRLGKGPGWVGLGDRVGTIDDATELFYTGAPFVEVLDWEIAAALSTVEPNHLREWARLESGVDDHDHVFRDLDDVIQQRDPARSWFLIAFGNHSL